MHLDVEQRLTAFDRNFDFNLGRAAFGEILMLTLVGLHVGYPVRVPNLDTDFVSALGPKKPTENLNRIRYCFIFLLGQGTSNFRVVGHQIYINRCVMCHMRLGTFRFFRLAHPVSCWKGRRLVGKFLSPFAVNNVSKDYLSG